MADEEEVVLETVGEAGKSLADQADARILVRLHGADAARAEQRARRREDEQCSFHWTSVLGAESCSSPYSVCLKAL